MHVESYVKISRCVENVYVRRDENHIENRVEVRKKTPSHFTARVEIERQISFFSFGFARVSEVRHMYSCKYKEEKIYFHNYKHFYRQDQEQYLFNITDTIPVRNKLERKCCFVHNKCSDRNVTECENAKEIQELLKRLQGSHSTWKTWKK